MVEHSTFWRRAGRVLLTLTVLFGYLASGFWALWAVVTLSHSLGRLLSLRDAWVALTMVGCLAVAALGAVLLRVLSDVTERVRIELLALVFLPVWGLVLNALAETCSPYCPSTDGVYRPLAVPEVFGFGVLHVGVGIAYAISRRRALDLPASAERWVAALLVLGLVMQCALGLQFLDLLPWLVLFPLTLPILTPFILTALYWLELARRLRRAAERSPEPILLPAALKRFPLLLGAYLLAQGFAFGRSTAGLDVFAGTCTHLLSQLPLTPQHSSCGHYLCTVAARGHARLVRPLRIGRRRGAPILVNRQLAIANAFEDLLHERWPRFGRAARRVYDRLGLPVSRLIRSPWLADAIYLVMKPAECVFYIVLALFDREDPETRIDRMYR